VVIGQISDQLTGSSKNSGEASKAKGPLEAMDTNMMSTLFKKTSEIIMSGKFKENLDKSLKKAEAKKMEEGGAERMKEDL